MVTDEMVRRAATEYLSHRGERPYRVTRRGAELWEDHAPAMRAALEDALSAAEPRGYLVHDKDNPDGRYFKQKPSISDDDMSEYEIWIEPLYAAPPAPSVAVKAIEAVWKYSLVIESSVRRGDGPEQYAGVTEALRLVKEARSAFSAQVQDVAGWQPIETAPHDTNVLLAWTDSTLPCGWKMEAGMASWGWRRDGVSNMSEHGQATHWMPLPAAPAKQEG